MEYLSQSWIGTLLPILAAATLLLLRRKRLSRVMPLRIGRLWILPAFHLCLVLFIYWVHPPHGLTWLYVAMGFLIGLPLGWYRGRLTRISVDPDTLELSQQTSPAVILFILVLVSARQVGRNMALGEGGYSIEAVFVVTDIMLAFAFGFLATQRVELALRARTLLALARASRS